MHFKSNSSCITEKKNRIGLRKYVDKHSKKWLSSDSHDSTCFLPRDFMNPKNFF